MSDILALPETSLMRCEHLYRYCRARQCIGHGDGAVLDAACGYGYGTAILAEWRPNVMGLELDPAAVAVARQRYPGVRFAVADLETVTLPRCEVVVTIETVEYLRDPLAWVAKCKAAAGAVVLSTPIIPTKHDTPEHLHDFTLDQVCGWFADWRCLWLETLARFFVIGAWVRP